MGVLPVLVSALVGAASGAPTCDTVCTVPAEVTDLTVHVRGDSGPWSLAWDCADSVHYCYAEVRRIDHTKWDDTYGQQWQARVLRRAGDSVAMLDRRVFAAAGDSCGLRLVRHGDCVRLRVGDTLTLADGKIPCALPAGSAITVNAARPGQVRVLAREMATLVPVSEARFADMEALTAYLERARDAAEGFYRLLDRDMMQPATVQSDGRYDLALVADGSGGYDIVHIDGGEVTRRHWRPLQVRGHLTPTPFAGNFDLVWIDALRRHRLDSDNYAIVDPVTGTLTLFFPLYSSHLRLARLP